MIFSLIVIGVIVFASMMGSGGGGLGPGREVVSSLREKRDQCQTAVANLLRLGVRVDRDHKGQTTAEYDEANWAALDHDDKIRQALLWLCADMPPDGGGYDVFIRGRKTGKILASVIGGNYFDN